MTYFAIRNADGEWRQHGLYGPDLFFRAEQAAAESSPTDSVVEVSLVPVGSGDPETEAKVRAARKRLSEQAARDANG